MVSGFRASVCAKEITTSTIRFLPSFVLFACLILWLSFQFACYYFQAFLFFTQIVLFCFFVFLVYSSETFRRMFYQVLK